MTTNQPPDHQSSRNVSSFVAAAASTTPTPTKFLLPSVIVTPTLNKILRITTPSTSSLSLLLLLLLFFLHLLSPHSHIHTLTDISPMPKRLVGGLDGWFGVRDRMMMMALGKSPLSLPFSWLTPFSAYVIYPKQSINHVSIIIALIDIDYIEVIEQSSSKSPLSLSLHS